MSANPATRQQQQSPPPPRPFTAQDARAYTKHHQQVQFIINRICNLLEVPNKAARTIQGLHGMLNGIDRAKFPVFRAHQFTARQMNFKGGEDNCDTFMFRALQALDDAELKCGHRFFGITRADGVTQRITSYDADYLSDAAEDALMRVKNSLNYAKNPAKAVTDEILWAAINRHLPAPAPEPKAAGDHEAGGASLTDDQIIKATWTRVENLSIGNLERIVAAGGDPLREVEFICMRLRRAAYAKHHEMRRRDREERRQDLERLLEPEAGAGNEEGSDDFCDVVLNTSDSFLSPDTAEEAAPAASQPQEPPQIEGVNGEAPVASRPEGPPQTEGVNGENSPEKRENSATLLKWALFWAAQGVPVFPVHGVSGGVCSCREGRECQSAGKHPRTRAGLKEATLDDAQIQAWWRKWPGANIGGLTGGAVRLLVVDVDPKSGGDASLNDLTEVYGLDWLETLQVKTGSGGNHFFFTYPAGVELRNTAGKLAPGIDTRAEGGYVVLPPSVHLSGRHYQLQNTIMAQPLPAWLLEELTRAPETPKTSVIDFQERREFHARDGALIAEGERNVRLFKIGCGIWATGAAPDLTGLHAQLLAVNAQRVTPALDDAEVAKIAASIVGRYPRGV